jgi:hypothetical protein
MPNRADPIEDVCLPSLEAVVAGTLALMTGYSQSLQADTSPGQRLSMGRKIGRNLDVLADHPGVTDEFRRIVQSLHRRWVQMGECTRLAAPPGACDDAFQQADGDTRIALAAPARVQ